MSLLPEAPPARFVMSRDGIKIATYDFGDPDARPVVAVHGFASSAILNWHHAGWTRDLTRAGYRVIALDLRGHGASEKPHESAQYTMNLLADDVFTVIENYLLEDVTYLGYSLGARVGWHLAPRLPDAVGRAVLGGVPDGSPLTKFDVAQARALLAEGTPVTDRLTDASLSMARGIPGNDVPALLALVEGMRDARNPAEGDAPPQPLLLATGSDDPILDASRRLAAAAPSAEFFEIPGRNHFNAPTSRAFRDAALAFLAR